MAQKTYKQIQDEANQKFGKGASQEKFEWRRAQQEAAGLDKESKKRGGVAGTYDRNKSVIQAAAPILAGMLIPGVGAGLSGAITGGLFKGLDRPGKGGIGLDVGQAAKGAIAGYGMGKLGSMAGAKLGIGQAAGAAPSVAAAGAPAPAAASSMASPASMPSGMGLGSVANANTVGAAQTPGRFGQMLTGIKENAPVIQAGLGAVSDVMGQQAQRKMQEQQLAQQQNQFQQTFDVSEEERKRRQAEANRLASMFIPRG